MKNKAILLILSTLLLSCRHGGDGIVAGYTTGLLASGVTTGGAVLTAKGKPKAGMGVSVAGGAIGLVSLGFLIWAGAKLTAEKKEIHKETEGIRITISDLRGRFLRMEERNRYKTKEETEKEKQKKKNLLEDLRKSRISACYSDCFDLFPGQLDKRRLCHKRCYRQHGK